MLLKGEVELRDVVDGEAVVVAAVEVEVLVEVGLELETEVGEELGVESPAPLPPASKTTMFAFWPLGTVTTQKEAPPAPSALSKEVTPFKPLEGSILQGRPLQPAPSSQVISTPKEGGVFRNGVAGSWTTGLWPILTKVFPWASVFAPAT